MGHEPKSPAASRERSRPDAARRTAFEVIRDVRLGGSWDEAWQRHGTRVASGSLDRRFAQELASGGLRLRAKLDYSLRQYCDQPLAALEPDVLDLLRLAAYQLLEMDRVTDWSAVDTTVELTKGIAPRAAGLVNAVLRALLRRREDIVYPDPNEDPLAHATTAGSHPEWIASRWLARFGRDEMLQLCAYDNTRPDLCLRVSMPRCARDVVANSLEGAVPTRWSPVGVRVPVGHFSRVRDLLDGGIVSVQDESATLVGLETGATQGETWLDLAAAPGGKTCHLAELVGPAGQVHAYDVSAAKVRRIRDNAVRLGLQNVSAKVGDGRELRSSSVDGVLLDAPCSGLGVLARRPDARWRKRGADLDRHAARQGELLQAAANHVRPGGVLVYSVCSFEPEETSAVVERFQREHGDFFPESGGAHASLHESPGILYFLPQRHGTDGGFVARWRRRD